MRCERGRLGILLALAAAVSCIGQDTGDVAGDGDVVLRMLSREGTVEHRFAEGVSVFTNGVEIVYGDVVLTADSGSADLASGEIEAVGDVRLREGDRLWRGERLRYNYRTRRIRGDRFRSAEEPFFIAGEGAGIPAADEGGEGEGQPRPYRAVDATVTSDDLADPGYRVVAKELNVVPGQWLVARDARVYVGDVPVMYLPVYRRRLSQHRRYWEVQPGYRSRDGALALGTYHFMRTDKLDAAVRLDYRTRRGVAGGPILGYDLGDLGKGRGDFYYLRDGTPGLDPQGQPIRTDRYRINWAHRADIRTNLTATAVLRKLSDAQIQRDFFESDHRTNTQPDSFFETDWQGRDHALNLLVRPQLNDFYERVERLPDLRLTSYPQPVGVTPLYYQGESSVGYFQRRSANNAFEDYAAERFDTLHELSAPRTIGGWLQATPRVGGRFTHYGETDGQGSVLQSQDRWLFHTGAEVSAKASRLWRGARSRFWEVDGLRHILQPTLRYVYVPRPGVRPGDIPQFDTRFPSFRLLPIDFPADNSIDAIDSRNVVRIGLRNRLQTRRGNALDQLVHWSLYTDWRLNPEPGQATFSDFFSDLDLRPRSWLTFTSQIRYDVNRWLWREANHFMTLTPGSVWSWSLGHRYLRDDPETGTGNNIIQSVYYLRLNENWGLRTGHHFEARDGVLEEQYYSIYRDFRSWTAALTLRLQDHRDGRDDITVGLVLSMKSFPQFAVGEDRLNPSLLLGR